MTPLSFEWQWNADYLIFMGLLYLALAVVGYGFLVFSLAYRYLPMFPKEIELNALPAE